MLAGSFAVKEAIRSGEWKITDGINAPRRGRMVILRAFPIGSEIMVGMERWGVHQVDSCVDYPHQE